MPHFMLEFALDKLASTQGWPCVIKVRATEIKKCSSPPLSPSSDELE